MSKARLMLDGIDWGTFDLFYIEEDGRASISVLFDPQQDLEPWKIWRERRPTEYVYQNYQFRIARVTLPDDPEVKIVTNTELVSLTDSGAIMRGDLIGARPTPEPAPDPSNGRDSPCVAICSTLYDDVCRGCGRTAMEVAEWVFLDQEEKRKIWVRITAEGYPTRKI